MQISVQGLAFVNPLLSEMRALWNCQHVTSLKMNTGPLLFLSTVQSSPQVVSSISTCPETIYMPSIPRTVNLKPRILFPYSVPRYNRLSNILLRCSAGIWIWTVPNFIHHHSASSLAHTQAHLILFFLSLNNKTINQEAQLISVGLLFSFLFLPIYKLTNIGHSISSSFTILIVNLF